ncbi:MAG: nucleoside monophosphate kinase, partial [Promicromonosporaceae bacterium]|nr:nucleoside monophosphate kinase [Promicromonosporaceae bacterium]
GRKKVLLVSLVVFGAGSALCAYSTTPEEFLTARLLMGVAGAGIAVMALSAVTIFFDEASRPKAVGVFAAANFLSLPLGPILGGWMLANLWWGWVFLLNVPVVVIGLLAVIVLIPESRAEERPGLDVVGMLASVAGLVVFTYGIIEAGQNGWTDAAALASLGLHLDGVIELAVPDALLLDRITKRAEIEGRADDTPESIARRLAIYAESTAPLLAEYGDRGLLVKVDGAGDVDTIFTRIQEALATRLA